MATYVLLHGWGGDSCSNWFPSVRERLESRGHEVLAPSFPNTETPDYDEWEAYFTAEVLPHIDSDTIVVGHSLGCPFILRFITENKIPVAELHLVAPAPDDCGAEEITTFFTRRWDILWVRETVKNIEIYGSDNDQFIPLEKFKLLAADFHAKFHFIPNRGHLNSETLPELFA